MTTTNASGADLFGQRTRTLLDELEASGQYKHLQMIESPMGPSIDIRGVGTVDCFCSNNYLGLANHPEVVEAGIEGLRKWGGVRRRFDSFAAHSPLMSNSNSRSHHFLEQKRPTRLSLAGPPLRRSFQPFVIQAMSLSAMNSTMLASLMRCG